MSYELWGTKGKKKVKFGTFKTKAAAETRKGTEWFDFMNKGVHFSIRKKVKESK